MCLINLHFINCKTVFTSVYIHTYIHTYMCVGLSTIMNLSNFLVIENSVYKSIFEVLPELNQNFLINSNYTGINVLCGVGILSTSYAVKEGGWAGLSILFIFAALSFYTGILLRYCLDSAPGLETYPDIGQAAFGNFGRVAISVCLVEFFIYFLFLELILPMKYSTK